MAQVVTVLALLLLVGLVVLGRRMRPRLKNPKAGNTQSEATAESACQCCGYDLHGLSTLRCPECGTLAGFTKPIHQIGISEQEARELFSASPLEHPESGSEAKIATSRASDDLALREVYGRGAREYERIYQRDDPVRQSEQAELAAAIRELFAGRRVLELACGTGYWTRELAAAAQRVVAIDASQKMLGVAREKKLPADVVELREGDAYKLDEIAGDFDACLANFWFSHVPKARIAEFLDGLHRRLEPGAVVLMADNVYDSEVGGELFTQAGVTDTYKRRKLDDGAEYVVLKNYYNAERLAAIFEPRSTELSIHSGRCFWWLRYLTA